MARRTLTVGLQHCSRAQLEAVVAAIESVTVLGAFQASPAVRRALAGRIH